MEQVMVRTRGCWGWGRREATSGDRKRPSDWPRGRGAVSDVGDEGGTGVEGVEDGGLGGGAPSWVRKIFSTDLGGEEGGDVVGVGLEVSGEVGVVGDEDGLTGEGTAGVLEGEDLLDGGLGLGEGGGGDASDGEVGEESSPLTEARGGRRGSRGRRTW